MLKKIYTYQLYWKILRVCMVSSFLLFTSNISSQSDSLSVSEFVTQSDSLPDADTTVQTIDDVDRDTYISASKSVMEEDVTYDAVDSIIMLADGTVVMYNGAKVNYGDVELEAYYIRLNRDSNLIYAEGIEDSTGHLVQTPIFSDGGQTFDAETIRYNFATGKGLIYNVASEQADGFVNGGITKRVDAESLCMKSGRYTTCSNKDHPHFYLMMTKAKVRPGKSIVTGPAYLVMEEVPLPIVIPFGYFPFTSTYSSGFLMPTYGEEQRRGFYLKNGGYYFALSDYMDLAFTGDIYSMGSWALNAKSQYRKRYKFSGNFSSNYRVNVSGDKELDTYSKSTDFAVRWTHSQDAKASMYSTFSASVNFSSSSYESNDLDRIYNQSRTNNHKSSSISYSKRFPEAPFNLSLSANASQNASDSSVTVSLPQLSVSMNRIYPFKRKTKIGADRWYEKIGMSYSGNTSNTFSGYQQDMFTSNIVTDWKNGMKHSIPVSTSFQIFDKITVSPSINYTERWYTSSVEQSWDTTTNAVQRDTTWGFNRVYDYSTSVSMSTKLYGMYNPYRKIFGDKVEAIRHVMTPSVSLGWRPDFGQDKFGYYDTYEKITSDSTSSEVEYSRYYGSLYGTPGKGKSGTVGFSLGNNIEMKVRDDQDSTADFKKVKLIDRLNFSTGYNLMADSLNWSNVSASLGFTVFKKSVNISAAFDPYSFDSKGNKINTFYMEDYGKLLRLTRASTSMGLSINEKKIREFMDKFSGTETGGEGEGSSAPGGAKKGGADDDKSKGTDKARFDEYGYLKFSMPWSLNFSYSVSVNSTWDTDLEDYIFEGNSNLSMSGNISLTDKWKFSFNSGYNFRTNDLASTRFSVTRDLHCWSMSANFVPIGTYKSYSFAIHVNSAMLQDLKYDKRSSPWDSSIWD